MNPIYSQDSMTKHSPSNESTVMTTVQPSDSEAHIYELLNIGENESLSMLREDSPKSYGLLTLSLPIRMGE